MRLQSAIEFLSTYSFLFIILGIMIAILYFITSAPTSTIPTQCSGYGGPTCLFVELYSNTSQSYSVATLAFVNSQPATINLTNFSVRVGASNSFAYGCIPNVVYQGGTATCLAVLHGGTSTGVGISGFYTLGAKVCNSPVSLQINCTTGSNVLYGGSFYVSSTPSLPLIFSTRVMQSPSNQQLTPFSINNPVSIPTNYNVIQNGAFTASSGGYAFGTNSYVGKTELGMLVSPFPPDISALNRNSISCSWPANSIYAMSYAPIYINGSTTSDAQITLYSNNAIELYYGNSLTSFNTLLNGAGWRSNFATKTFGPIAIKLYPGVDYIAILWSNLCDDGTQVVGFNGLYTGTVPVTSSISTVATTSIFSSTTSTTSSTTTSTTTTSSTSTTTVAPLALDGSGSNAYTGANCNSLSPNTCTASLTTINPHDALICAVRQAASSDEITLSSSPSLIWTGRTSTNVGGMQEDTFNTIWSSSGAITITASSENLVNGLGIICYGVSGPLTGTFDMNAALPSILTCSLGASCSTTISTSVSTSNANDLIYGCLTTQASSAISSGSGFTPISSISSGGIGMLCEYQIVSTTQSNLAVSGTTGLQKDWIANGDAVAGLSLNPSTHYVPITITNSQTSATPSTFQQELLINSNNYASYINSNWFNVEFTTGPAGTGTVLNAWVENSPTNTATNTIVWVQLQSSIAGSGGTQTIYMDFMGTNVMSASGPTGEAPQLSSSYAQYDNGAQVFDWYENFAGITIPSDMSLAPVGTTSPSVNNGLNIISSANNAGVYYKTTPINANVIMAYVTSVSGGWLTLVGADLAAPTAQSAGSAGLWLSLGSSYTNEYAYTGLSYIRKDVSGTASILATSGGIVTGPHVIIFSWPATGTEHTQVDYGSTLSATDSSNAKGSTVYPVIANYGGNSAASTAVFQWVRAQQYPPSGIMPGVNFGSVV